MSPPILSRVGEEKSVLIIYSAHLDPRRQTRGPTLKINPATWQAGPGSAGAGIFRWWLLRSPIQQGVMSRHPLAKWGPKGGSQTPTGLPCYQTHLGLRAVAITDALLVFCLKTFVGICQEGFVANM